MSLSYQLDEKREMIRSSVREFAENEIKPIAGDLEEREEFSVSLTQEMGKLFAKIGKFMGDPDVKKAFKKWETAMNKLEGDEKKDSEEDESGNE